MLCAVKVGSKVVWILSLGNCSFYPFQVFFVCFGPVCLLCLRLIFGELLKFVIISTFRKEGATDTRMFFT